ncbi:ImmA/IrrE family metallo-endopeptidase [Lactococcus protaetiae]|nr:ImmA/IrrE family metallo-endopeptidase [Lactococcus protaetiae]
MEYNALIKELGVEVILFYPTNPESQTDGIYFPDDNIIFVNGMLAEIERENIILHELGHLISGHYRYDCQPDMIHVGEENQADRYMVKSRAEQYLESFDDQPDYIDIHGFLTLFHIKPSLYDMADSVFRQLLNYSN